MKILLLGKNGQVGWELNRTLAPAYKVFAYGREELDLEDEKKVRHVLKKKTFDLIINAAAYTNVEHAEKEPEKAFALNTQLPKILGEEASKNGAAVIHFSTDYVFDGKKGSPYTEEDKPNPLNVYGYSKLLGEEALKNEGIPHIILRISWVYGIRGNNFFLKILKTGKEGKPLSVVNDQFGTPTWSKFVAENTAQIIRLGENNIKDHISANKGIYHLAPHGVVSWHGFAQKITSKEAELRGGTPPQVNAIQSKEFTASAIRPAYSVLNTEKACEAFSLKLNNWKDSLDRCMKDMTSQ